MKQLNEFKKYVLYGGGVMAERLSVQLEKSEMELVAVADNLNPQNRKVTNFKGFEIRNLKEEKSEIGDDTCVILAINAFFSLNAIEYYLGSDTAELQNFVVQNGLSGIDRIVPVGKTADFAFVWDGYDLIEGMSRCVKMLF